jgi:hypothetical protein
MYILLFGRSIPGRRLTPMDDRITRERPQQPLIDKFPEVFCVLPAGRSGPGRTGTRTFCLWLSGQFTDFYIGGFTAAVMGDQKEGMNI